MRTEDLVRLLSEDLPTRPVPPGPMLAGWLLVAACVTGTAFLIAAGARQDLLAAGLMPTLMKLFLGALLVWGALTGARTLTRPEATLSEGLRRLVVIGLFLAALLAFDLAKQGGDGWLVRLHGKNIMACLTIIPALALLPLAGTLYALRAGAPTAPAAAGALVGLASAGMAIIAYGLFCTENSPVFVTVWYMLAAMIVASLGALLGRTLLRW